MMITLKQPDVEQLKLQSGNGTSILNCGALIGYTEGKDVIINELIVLENEKFENKKERYLISPQQYIKTEDYALSKNLQLLGFYYNITGEITSPSEFDLVNALPGFIYLICSKSNEGELLLSGWTLNENRKSFRSENLEILRNEETILSPVLAIAV